MPDSHHQVGAAAAAAAGGAAGGRGECQRPRPAGEAHQHHPGPHGRAAGVRLHAGQLHHPADEDTGTGRCDRPSGPAALHPLEALGLPGALSPVAAAQLSGPTAGQADRQSPPGSEPRICVVWNQTYTSEMDWRLTMGDSETNRLNEIHCTFERKCRQTRCGGGFVTYNPTMELHGEDCLRWWKAICLIDGCETVEGNCWVSYGDYHDK